MAEAPLRSRAALWISLALAAAVAILYAPVWSYGFVTWDDPQYITQNPYIARGLTGSGISWAFTSGYLYYWHPLTWISHMLDIQLFGYNAGGHHAVSVLLHIANSVLLFLLLRKMTGATAPSAFVAGLFAVHPLHVESVAWVSERKDVLSTFFWILTLWVYTNYVRKPSVKRHAIALVLFAAALMSKPMVVTLPFLMLLLDYWPLNRFSEGLPKLIREKVPMFALAVAASIATFLAQRQAGAVAGLDTFPLGSRIANALLSYATYIVKMIWPSGLAVLYPYLPIPAWQVAGAALLLGAITWIAWRMAARRPYFLVGWLWFVGTLVPVIGLIQAGGVAWADRFTYVPMVGLFVAIAWWIADFARERQVQGLGLPIAAVVVLLAFAAGAGAQIRYWRDSEALWGRTIEVTEMNYRAHNNLGVDLSNKGRGDEAIAHYREALRIRPDFAEGHNNLGAALLQKSDLAGAIDQYTEALRLDPQNAEAHNNLGVAYADQGKIDEAIGQFLESLRINPDQPNTQCNVALMLDKRGRVAEAIEHFQAALRLDPGHAEARRGLSEITQRR